MTIITRAKRDEAMALLGIDTKDVLRVLFTPDAIKVYKLQRDSNGKIVALNDGPAETSKTYTVSPR